MSKQRYTNRRTVLKTLGASAVGGVMFAGSASADHYTDVTNGTISETADNTFDPEDAEVDLASSNPATVTFVNNADHDHNVTVHEAGVDSNMVKSKAIPPGGMYEVKFSDNGDGTFTVMETDSHGNAGDETQSITVPYKGAHDNELGMHCDLHDIPGLDAFSMHGTINVVEPADEEERNR